MACKKPQQRKKESGRLRGGRDQIQFTDLKLFREKQLFI